MAPAWQAATTVVAEPRLSLVRFKLAAIPATSPKVMRPARTAPTMRFIKNAPKLRFPPPTTAFERWNKFRNMTQKDQGGGVPAGAPARLGRPDLRAQGARCQLLGEEASISVGLAVSLEPLPDEPPSLDV